MERTSNTTNTTKQKKKRLTLEERAIELEKYLQHKSNYPKGQLCTFYLRGLCWIENCHYAHGIDDLDWSMFMKFYKDKQNKKVTNNDLVRNIQKTYLILKRDYKILFEFQEANKDKLSNYLTKDQLNEDPRRRVEIRRMFLNSDFEKFCYLIFTRVNKTLSIQEFEGYVDCLGFNICFRYFDQKFLFSKSVMDKTSNKKKSIMKLMPAAEHIINNFIKIVLNKIEEDLTNSELIKVFPISFKYVNNIVNKHAEFEDPLIHHYLKLKNIISSEFMEELVNHTNFIQNLEKLFLSKNMQMPLQIVYNQNITETLIEIKDTCWDKYSNSEGNHLYGFMKFEFIKENYIDKIITHKECTVNEAYLVFQVKKFLNSGKNLLFMNNNHNLFILNNSNFGNSNCLKEYHESVFEQRCKVEDPEVQKVVSKFFQNENEIDLSVFKSNLPLLSSEDEEACSYSNKEIVLIDNDTSFYYFIKKATEFTKISVDLEGHLCKHACQVDLIQICDVKFHQVFILDIYKIVFIDKNLNLFKNLKIILTWLLESNTITKVFHDGRKDCLALHEFFQICPSNYIDTSCLFSAAKQFRLQIDFYNKFLKKITSENLTSSSSDNKNIDTEFSNLYSYLYNSVCPGINKVLEKYESNKNINHLKDKIHEMFKQKQYRESFFLKRPIEEEFLIYSALDVKYLNDATINLQKELEKILTEFYNDSKNVEIIMRLVSHEHMKMNCEDVIK